MGTGDLHQATYNRAYELAALGEDVSNPLPIWSEYFGDWERGANDGLDSIQPKTNTKRKK